MYSKTGKIFFSKTGLRNRVALEVSPTAAFENILTPIFFCRNADLALLVPDFDRFKISEKFEHLFDSN